VKFVSTVTVPLYAYNLYTKHKLVNYTCI